VNYKQLSVPLRPSLIKNISYKVPLGINIFGGGVTVVNDTVEVLVFIRAENWENAVLLMMSSGNFDGIDYDLLGEELMK
jgi:hypothetical protein